MRAKHALARPPRLAGRVSQVASSALVSLIWFDFTQPAGYGINTALQRFKVYYRTYFTKSRVSRTNLPRQRFFRQLLFLSERFFPLHHRTGGHVVTLALLRAPRWPGKAAAAADLAAAHAATALPSEPRCLFTPAGFLDRRMKRRRTTLSGPAPLWTGWLVYMDYLSKMAWFLRAAFRRCPAQTPPPSELGVSSTPPPPE